MVRLTHLSGSLQGTSSMSPKAVIRIGRGAACDVRFDPQVDTRVSAYHAEIRFSKGHYVIVFPDLPGCLTQVETAEEIGPMAEDARRAWMESVYEVGPEIPLPSYPEEFSGKFNLPSHDAS